MAKVNMKTAARILLIVAATIINTECFRIFEKRQVSDYSDDETSYQDSYSTDEITSCPENIANCTSTLFDQPFLRSFNFGTLAPIIDQVCTDYHTARQCLGPVLQTCRTIQGLLTYIDGTFGFFCSNRGQSLLREFQESVCYNDFPDIFQYWPICNPDISGDYSGDNGETIRQCIARSFTADCGEAAGQIVSAIFNIEPQNDADNEFWNVADEEAFRVLFTTHNPKLCRYDEASAIPANKSQQ